MDDLHDAAEGKIIIGSGLGVVGLCFERLAGDGRGIQVATDLAEGFFIRVFEGRGDADAGRGGGAVGQFLGANGRVFAAPGQSQREAQQGASETREDVHKKEIK